MKKLQVVLTIVAVMTAGIGVFASQFTNFDTIIENRTDDPLTATVIDCEKSTTKTCNGTGTGCQVTVSGFVENVFQYNSANPSTCVQLKN